MKTLKLLNKTFKVNNKLKPTYNLKALNECYARPSYYKQRAYNDCFDFVEDLRYNNFDIIDWGVASYNTSMFTFMIICQDLTTLKCYVILFTHCNDYIREVDFNE